MVKASYLVMGITSCIVIVCICVLPLPVCSLQSVPVALLAFAHWCSCDYSMPLLSFLITPMSSHAW